MWALLPLLAALAALPDDPRAALAEVDDRAAALSTIRYGAVRTSTQGELEQRESWHFASEPGGRFRIDYAGDTKRQIVCDGHTLWDYVPAARQAQRFDLDAMDRDERDALLGRVLSRVSVPGLRTGWQATADATYAWGVDGDEGGRPTREVLVTDDVGGRLSFVLDVEGGYLVSSRIDKSGDFVVETSGSAHKEVRPGVWVPTRVTSTSPAPGGKVRVELQLNQSTVGQDLPDSLFEWTENPAVNVTEHP